MFHTRMERTLGVALVALAASCGARDNAATPASTGPDVAFALHGDAVRFRQVTLSLSRWDGRVAPVLAARSSADQRAVLERSGGVTEWYQERPRGLEQGFEAQTPPSGDRLAFELALSGARAEPAGDGKLALTDATGKVVAYYGEAAAHDARGASLPVHLEARGDSIAVHVDVRGAAWPVSIDPLIWIAQQKLVASDGAAGDALGYSLALSGTTAIAGAQNLDGQQGATYVFVRSGSSWAQQQKLVASDATAGALFGHSTAIDGDTAVVAAVGAYAGYVFTRSGSTWTQQQKLSGASDAVAIDGDSIVGGAVGGPAHVFVRSGTTWSEQQTLVASDGTSNDGFGFKVAISGDTAIVSAYRADVGAHLQQGAAYVFVRSGTTWTEQQKLVASDGTDSDRFGHAVALSGDTALVGIDAFPGGGAYVFARSGTTWTEQQKLASGGPSTESLGFSVALDGDIALVGALFGNAGPGAAYAFARSGTTWTQQATLAAADGSSNDQLGFATALSGKTALASAVNADIGSNGDQGAGYVFMLQGASCQSGADCGYCIDGTCCADACTTPCRSCATGTCSTPVTNQDDDNCSGASTCSVSGACLPKNGQACTAPGDCASGFCVDGVCCNTACGGACDVCSQALGASADGTCSPAPAGSSGSPACAPLVCDGTSAACPTSCASDAACAAGSYCAADATCKTRIAQSGACDDRAGKDCLVSGCRECATPGGCVDGYCCEAACDGACDVCDATPGTCTNAAARAPGFPSCSPYLCSGAAAACATTCAADTDCATGAWCDSGACVGQKTSGSACSGSNQCASGYCVDGVCCESACDGQCEACDVFGATGTCTPIVGAPHGTRGACAAASPGEPCSARRCDGTDRTSCAGLADSSTICAPASCAGGVGTLQAACDGNGACLTAQSVACGAYACGATACKTACTGDEDCSSTTRCDTLSHECTSGATCKGAATAVDPAGNEQDCSPYACASGRCNTDCSSSADCVADAICDPDRKTCTTQVSSGSDNTGCGCRISGMPVRRRDGALVWLVALALVARRRRRGNRA